MIVKLGVNGETVEFHLWSGGPGRWHVGYGPGVVLGEVYKLTKLAGNPYVWAARPVDGVKLKLAHKRRADAIVALYEEVCSREPR